MQVTSINNNNPNFGHSFRVSICLTDGFKTDFVNPSKNESLYKKLNSKIVGWLNEDYYSSLRSTYGLPRKVSKQQPSGDVHKKLIQELRKIDNDYARLNLVRSVYRKNKVACIATGPDVAIIEQSKGIKYLGEAKSDSLLTYGTTLTDYVKELSKAVRKNVIRFVESDSVLLRSKNDKEIMLKAIFKKTGTEKKPIYELDSFEFHENISKPTLKPVNSNYSMFKQSREMQEKIKRTIQNQIKVMLGENNK